jgi:hypothetical protein
MPKKLGNDILNFHHQSCESWEDDAHEPRYELHQETRDKPVSVYYNDFVRMNLAMKMMTVYVLVVATMDCNCDALVDKYALIPQSPVVFVCVSFAQLQYQQHTGSLIS